MANASREKQIWRGAAFKSTMWQHFGFRVQYDDEGKKTVIKQSRVCMHCFATVGYLMSHLRRHHSALSQVGQGESTRYRKHNNLALWPSNNYL